MGGLKNDTVIQVRKQKQQNFPEEKKFSSKGKTKNKKKCILDIKCPLQIFHNFLKRGEDSDRYFEKRF